jgi:heptosyltransferase-2
MATPAAALLRHHLPKSVIVGLGRVGATELLAGADHLLDEVIEADTRSTLGPAKVAGRLRPMKFDAALILPNSFASAMTVRLAGIEVRVGYDRDGRGMLLTHRLNPTKRAKPLFSSEGAWAPVSAVDYYLRAARELLLALVAQERLTPKPTDPPIALELGTSRGQDQQGLELLERAGIAGPGGHSAPFALLNPGGNNPAKRWPVERFAAVAHHLITRRGLRVLINGAPSERDLCGLIAQVIGLNHPGDAPMVASLPELGGTIGTLKVVTRAARIMVTNDTGPRHVAAAFATPCVTLFGPTDPRWTTLPASFSKPGVPREVVLVADPTLPATEVADDHPQRCRIDRIATGQVISAVDQVLA